MTGVRCRAAASATTRPTAVEPVKNTWSHGWLSKALASGTPPSTIVTASASRYRGTSRPSADAQAAETSDGLPTTQLPAASAAAIGSKSSWSG